MKKYRVGIIGATGMVGQRFLLLLQNHPLFEVTALLASANSAGQKYSDCVKSRWMMPECIPQKFAGMTILNASDMDTVRSLVDFVFCAVNMPKDELLALEERYAKAEIPVISNNSVNRNNPLVPMIIPEINANHAEIIPMQRKKLGTKRGFIAVKSNCSIQSYLPALHPLKEFGLEKVAVCTYQAISGAGRTFETMPNIIDNIIPFIKGEEEKSEHEPLKIWGKVTQNGIVNATSPKISAQCLRVPVSDGHTAAIFVQFKNKPTKQQILDAWQNYKSPIASLNLPLAPKQFLHYLAEEDRPQAKLDRDCENGMGITLGRLREDCVFDYKFICLSHNTLRGAAGGAILMAELLAKQGYFDA